MYIQKGFTPELKFTTLRAQKIEDEGDSLLERNWIPLPSLSLYTPWANFLISWNQISWGSSIKSHAYCHAQKTLSLLETGSGELNESLLAHFY